MCSLGKSYHLAKITSFPKVGITQPLRRGSNSTHWKVLGFDYHASTYLLKPAVQRQSAFTKQEVKKRALLWPVPRTCKHIWAAGCHYHIAFSLSDKKNSIQLLSTSDLKSYRFPCEFFVASIIQLCPGYPRAWAPVFRYLNIFMVVCTVVKLRVKSCCDLCWRSTAAHWLTCSCSKKTLGMTC